jgi:alpha-amylase
LKGNTVLNYLSSHDDGGPFDAKRTKTIEAGTKLLLSPELLRYFMVMKAPVLVVEGTQGDATLRSFMNWDAIKKS